jgi:DNA-binding CsgD family transcriptional regulator
MRAPGQKPFDKRQTRMLAELMPHIVRAARIDRRLCDARQLDELCNAALDRLSDAILVVDRSARLVRYNAAAQRMLILSRPLRMRHGRLHSEEEAQTARLHGLIEANALQSRLAGATGAMQLDTPEGARWIVLVAPLTPAARIFDLADRPLVLVIASRRGGAIGLEARLRQAFALTPAEARLAASLIAGATIEMIAADFQVRVPTLRTQLKSVFEKTATRRQGELMQLGVLLSALDDLNAGPR